MSFRERDPPRFKKCDEFHKSTRSHRERDRSYKKEDLIERRHSPYHKGRERESYKDSEKSSTFRSSYRRARSPSLDHKERHHVSPKTRSTTRFSEDDRCLYSGRTSRSEQRKSPDAWLSSVSKNSFSSIRRDSRSPIDIGRSGLGLITIRNQSYSPLRSRTRSFDRNDYRNNHKRRFSPAYEDRNIKRRSITPRKRSRSSNRESRSRHRKTCIKAHSRHERRKEVEKELSEIDTLSRSSIQRQIEYELKRKEFLEAQVRSREKKRSESSIERLLNDCKKSVEIKTDININNENIHGSSEEARERTNSPANERRKFIGLGHITIERGKSLEKSVSPIDYTEEPPLDIDFSNSIEIKPKEYKIGSHEETDKNRDIRSNTSRSLKEEFIFESDSNVRKIVETSARTVSLERVLPDNQLSTNRSELSQISQAGSITKEFGEKIETSPIKIVSLEAVTADEQLPTRTLELSPVSQAGSFENESPERLDLSPISIQDNFEQVDLLEKQEIEERNKANLSPFSQEGSFKDFEVDEKVSLSPISQAESFSKEKNMLAYKTPKKNPLIERPDSADSMQKFLAELEKSCERGSSSERELSPINGKMLKVIPGSRQTKTHTGRRGHSSSNITDKHSNVSRYKSSPDMWDDDINTFKERDLKYRSNRLNENKSNQPHKKCERFYPYEVSEDLSKSAYSKEESKRHPREMSLSSNDWKVPNERFSNRQLHSSISWSEQSSEKLSSAKHQESSLFERRVHNSQGEASLKYSHQNQRAGHVQTSSTNSQLLQNITAGNGTSQFSHMNSATASRDPFMLQSQSLSISSYASLLRQHSNICDQSAGQHSSTLGSVNGPRSNTNVQGGINETPLTAEELGQILKGFVIYFGVRKNSFLENDPSVVIQESFSRSDSFGKLSVCFLGDESSSQFSNEKVYELRWRGFTLSQGRAPSTVEAERLAAIDLINKLSQTSCIIQSKYQYYCGGILPSFMNGEKEQPNVYKMVRRADITSTSNVHATSQYGVNRKDVAAVLRYIDNFFRNDTYCELIFGQADVTEFTWQEMQRIIKHVVDSPILEYRMIKSNDKKKYIGLSRRHTPQEICSYLRENPGDHLRYRLLSPLQPNVKLLNPDGKINARAVNWNRWQTMQSTPVVVPNSQPPANMPQMPYDVNVMFNPSVPAPGMYPLSVPPPVPPPTIMPYDANVMFNPSVPAPRIFPQSAPQPVHHMTVKTLKPPPNRVLRSIEVIEID